MPGLLPDIDPDGLLEFSVVYTDRALNHMSKRFTGVMQDILGTLKEVYHAHTAVLVPGSGTFGMEAVARQFANKETVLIVRNGLHAEGATARHQHGGVGVVDLLEGGQDVLHDAGEALGHVIERAVGVDHREFEQAIGVDIGQQSGHEKISSDGV